MAVFDYVYFRNHAAANLVKICNIYARQMVVKMATSIITSDNLSRSYDNLYLGITLWDMVFSSSF